MATSLERYTELHPRVTDAVTVVALYACALYGAALTSSGFPQPDHPWLAQLLATISCPALMLSRAHPRAVLLLNTACMMVLACVGYLPNPLLMASLMAALYWLAALTDSATSRRYGWAVTAVLIGTWLFADQVADLFLLKTVGTGLWLLLPIAAGSRARLRRAYLESVQARAAHAERTREEEARLRVTEERMRIARELHDAVAHHMAVANAQAGTAAHLAASHPEQARTILSELTGTTSAALLELRATVGVLRSPDEPDSLEPAPGLERLPELIAGCRSAGLDVHVRIEGLPRALLPGVDLTAYRIIQEALTNVTKHADGYAAEVRLAYERSRLVITVTNEGGGGREQPGGFGLIGMRERAHSVGGDLRAGPRPEGGFEVTTALPLHPTTGPSE